MYQQWQGQFEEWFADVKSQLSGDVAGNLLHRIELSEDRIDEILKDLDVEVIDEHDPSYPSTINIRRIERKYPNGLFVGVSVHIISGITISDTTTNITAYGGIFSCSLKEYFGEFSSARIIRSKTSAVSPWDSMISLKLTQTEASRTIGVDVKTIETREYPLASTRSTSYEVTIDSRHVDSARASSLKIDVEACSTVWGKWK